jgi:SOS-response transcriptional repressor LexA
MTRKNTQKSTDLKMSEDKKNDFYQIPLIGLVQIKDNENNIKNYDLAELINNYPGKNNNRITLQVLDNAMIHAGIIQGDFVNIAINDKVKDGDIVVIALGVRIYIRRYYAEKYLIRLETEDKYHSPIVIDPKTPGLKLIGKVISITRQL